MPASQQTLEYLSKARQEGPDYYKYLSDEALYYRLENEGKPIPTQAVWEEQSFKDLQSKTSKSSANDLGFFASMADWLVTDDSYDWMKAAYNRSLTGATENLLSGEARYDVDETDFTILEDIGATMLSFLMPLDIITMGMGGFIGGKLANQALKSGLRGGAIRQAAKEGAKLAAKQGKTYTAIADDAIKGMLGTADKAVLGGIKQAPMLGLYEAAIHGVHNKIEGKSFLEGAAYGAFHGGALGFITGGIGGGMGAKQAQILKATNKNPMGKDWYKARVGWGIPGQIGAESSVFSATEIGERIIRGEDLAGEEIVKIFGRNAALFGALKVQGKLQQKFFEKIDFLDIKMRKDIIEGEVDQFKKSSENAKKNLEDKGESTEAFIEANYKATEKEIEATKTLEGLNASSKLLKEKILDKNGNLKDIPNPDKDTMVELNNWLIGKTEQLTKDKESIRDAVTKKQAEDLIKELESIKETIDKEWVGHLNRNGEAKKGVPEAVGEPVIVGYTKGEAVNRWKKETIETQAKKYGLETQIEYTPKGKIKNKKEIIDGIFRQEKAELGKTLLELKAKKETDIELAEEIERRITGKKSIKDIELEVLKGKTLDKKEKSIPLVKESGVSDRHKNLLAYTLDVAKKIAHGKGTKEALELFKYIEKKFGRNIDELTVKERDTLIKDYIQDRVKLDIYELTVSELNAKFKGPQGARQLRAIKRNADLIRDSLAEIFTKGELGKTLGNKDMVSIIGKFNVPGARKPTIVGGRAGFEKWIEFAKKKIKGFVYSKGKKISSEEAQLAIELASHPKALLRPGELVNVKANHINANTGEIKIIRQKVKGQKEDISYLVDKDLAQRLQNLADSKGIKGENRIFPFESAKDVSAFAKYLAKNSKADVKVQHDILGETFGWEDIIPGTKGVPDLKAGKGLEYGRVFRGLYEGEALTEAGKIEQTQALGQKKLHTKGHYKRKTIQEEVLKGKRKKQAVEEVNKQIEIGKEQQESQKQYFLSKPAYQKLKIYLGKILKPHQGKKVLGQIDKHVVKIAEGKVAVDTIPHEISHYVVDVLRQFGTRIDKSLIKRGEKMFGSEEALVQRIGEYAAGQLKNKTLISKAKSWVKAFNSRLKNMFGMATKEDVAYIMSRRVVKGNIPHRRKVANFINRMETHYQKDTKTKQINQIQAHKIEKRLEDEKIMTRKELDLIREEAGIDVKGKGRVKDWNDGDVQYWVEKLEAIEKKGKTSLEELNQEYQISTEEGEAIAVSLGQIDGNFNKLPPQGRKAYKDIIQNVGERTEKIITSTDLAVSIRDGSLPAVMGVSRMIMPAYYVLQKWGGKPGKAIAQKILRFDVVANMLYKGPGDVAVSLMKKELGRKNYKNVWMFDIERVEKRIRDGKDVNKPEISPLTKAEEIFYKNTLDKNGKEITYKTKLEDINTPEGKAKKLNADLMHHYWKSLYGEVEMINNKIEFDEFKKDFSEKFVNGYFTRRLTKEAYKHFISGKQGEKLNKVLDSTMESVSNNKAREAALKRFPKKGESYEKYFEKKKKELLESDSFKNEVAQDVLNMITHQHHLVKNRHLLKRGPLLDEFMTVTNPRTGKDKVIRVYEHNISNTVEPYIMTMSKYLATVRLFPEYSGVGGKYKLTTASRETIQAIIKDKTLGGYALRTIQKLVGFGGEDPLLGEAHVFLSRISHISAAAGLSSPTSGLKNLLIGIPRAIASYGFLRTGIGMTRLFDRNVWREAREKGALEYGAKHLELGQTKWGWMERLFKWNAMTLSENINRIVSIEAGKLYYNNQLMILHGNKGIFGERGVNNSRRLMRDMWKMSEKDIKFLESKEVRDMTFKSKESEGKYEYLIKQVEHFSHVSAQGGTSVGLLPLWASGKIGRPLTLFQRMAFATTWDSYRNYLRPAVKHKNFAPLARALMAHTASGAALYGFYKWMLDKEPPKSAGDSLDKVGMYLYRSEFLGLTGFLISPYDEGMFQSLAQPVIARNAREGINQLTTWYSGGQSFEDVIKNTALRTTVVYNQYDTWNKIKTSPQYKDRKVLWNWEKQFRDEFKITKPSAQVFSERTAYYKDLKEDIYFGSEKEIANAYFAAYNYIVTEMEELPGSTLNYRHKQAKGALEASLRSMNPVKLSAKLPKGRTMSKRQVFLNWIREHFGESGYQKAIKSEKEYNYLMRKVKKITSKGSLWKEKSVYSSQNLK